MNVTIILLIWLIPIGINVYLDRNGAKRDYKIVFIFRAIAAILHGIIAQALTFSYDGWADFFPLFVFQVTSFWIVFELALNIVRKKPLLYYDNKELDSGFWDRFFAKFPVWVHTVAKIMCLILMILSVIVVAQRA